MSIALRALWLFGVFMILARPLAAAEYTGKVVGISDGDTLTLLVPDGASFKQVKVRLGEIDTPERRQPYGTRAQQTLSELAYNQQARVVVQDTDRYGRTVGRVYVGNLFLHRRSVRRDPVPVTLHQKEAHDREPQNEEKAHHEIAIEPNILQDPGGLEQMDGPYREGNMQKQCSQQARVIPAAGRNG